jgi:hypothetical protein
MSLNNAYFLPFEALLSLYRMPGIRGRPGRGRNISEKVGIK